MQSKVHVGKTFVYDMRTRINARSLLPVVVRLHKQNQFHITFDASEKNKLIVNSPSKIPPMPHGSVAEDMLMRSVLYFAEFAGLPKFRMQPARIYSRENDLHDLQHFINDNCRGLFCIGRENGRGGIFRNSDIERELNPLEMILWGTDIAQPRLSQFGCVDGMGECTLDLMVFYQMA
jgi:hypothetical protein